MKTITTGTIIDTDPYTIAIEGFANEVRFMNSDEFSLDIGERIHVDAHWTSGFIDVQEVLRGDIENLHDLVEMALYQSGVLKAARMLFQLSVHCRKSHGDAEVLMRTAYAALKNSFGESDAHAAIFRAHESLEAGKYRDAQSHLYAAEAALDLYIRTKTRQCADCKSRAPSMIGRCRDHVMSDSAVEDELKSIIG